MGCTRRKLGWCAVSDRRAKSLKTFWRGSDGARGEMSKAGLPFSTTPAESARALPIAPSTETAGAWRWLLLGWIARTRCSQLAVPKVTESACFIECSAEIQIRRADTSRRRSALPTTGAHFVPSDPLNEDVVSAVHDRCRFQASKRFLLGKRARPLRSREAPERGP
jgi:hypothetical protein